MKRKPKQARAEATVSVILQAAAQVLLQRDYHSTSTNRIAERAGVSVGSIYQYFDNKNEIYDAVLNHYLAGLVARLETVEFGPELSFAEIVERLAFAIYHEWPDAPELLRKLRQAPDARVHDKLVDTKRLIVAFLRRTIDERSQAAMMRDLDLALPILMDAIEGIFLNARSDMTPELFANEISVLAERYLSVEGRGAESSSKPASSAS
ncbi:MAG: hypothetical protein DRH30_01475 [Deltaproteobacteria bacterium]|nr:MAG: hypothetical protein DRH30_01475 [Deltaproteobacteria bacterium]